MLVARMMQKLQRKDSCWWKSIQSYLYGISFLKTPNLQLILTSQGKSLVYDPSWWRLPVSVSRVDSKDLDTATSSTGGTRNRLTRVLSTKNSLYTVSRCFERCIRFSATLRSNTQESERSLSLKGKDSSDSRRRSLILL